MEGHLPPAFNPVLPRSSFSFIRTLHYELITICPGPVTIQHVMSAFLSRLTRILGIHIRLHTVENVKENNSIARPVVDMLTSMPSALLTRAPVAYVSSQNRHLSLSFQLLFILTQTCYYEPRKYRYFVNFAF